MANKETDVIGQQFARETTSDVTREMIRAGSMGKSRIAAGVKAAWHAKTGSMYGRDTTKMARFLRLMGQQNTAKWYDRFFATEKMKAQRASRSTGGGEGGTSDASVLAQVKLNTGLLKAQNKRIDAIHGLMDVVASDVLTIKTIITPRSGKAGGLANQNNEKAQTKANAVETAKLVLKVLDEEKSRAELRKKFAWKEEEENYRKKSDVEELGEKIDHIGLALGQMKKGGGFMQTIMTMLGSALGMISSFLAPAGLLAFAATLGYMVGTYLREKYKTSERIGDAVDWMADKFGIGNTQSKRDAADKAKLFAKVVEQNEKLTGTDWKAVDLGTYERLSDGKRFKGPELPEETKELFRQRGVGGFATDAPPAPQTGFSSETPRTGSLETAKESITVTPEVALLNQIAQGEGTSDAAAKSKGYESGYDVTLGYGAYNKPTKKPLSKMMLSEVNALQTEMLNHPDNDLNSSAVGKYQIIRDTLFGKKGTKSGYPWGGLVGQLGLKLSEIFSPRLQDRLATHLMRGRGLDEFKQGKMDSRELQKGFSKEWDSIEDPDTGKTGSGGVAKTKTGDIQPILGAVGRGDTTIATPVNGSLAKTVDQESKALQSFNNTPAPITVVAPQQQTVVNNMPNPTPPKPVQKGHALSNDPSFIRAANRNVVHPTETN